MRHAYLSALLLLPLALGAACNKRKRVRGPQCRARAAALATALGKVIEPPREELHIERAFDNSFRSFSKKKGVLVLVDPEISWEVSAGLAAQLAAVGVRRDRRVPSRRRLRYRCRA